MSFEIQLICMICITFTRGNNHQDTISDRYICTNVYTESTFLQKIMHNRLCDLGTHFECTSRKLNMFASAIDLNYIFVWDIVNGQRVKNRYCCKYRIKVSNEALKWKLILWYSRWKIIHNKESIYCIKWPKYSNWLYLFRNGKKVY